MHIIECSPQKNNKNLNPNTATFYIYIQMY